LARQLGFSIKKYDFIVLIFHLFLHMSPREKKRPTVVTSFLTDNSLQEKYKKIVANKTSRL